MQIKIKYIDKEIDKIKKLDQGTWLDLRSAITVELKQGEYKLIPLGIAIELPKNYEAHVAPRSSTFKNYGVLQVNSVAVIDESYCGNNDQWFWPIFATRDITINKNDRICQFRIIKKQPEIEFLEVDNLENPDRNGFGSTGIK